MTDRKNSFMQFGSLLIWLSYIRHLFLVFFQLILLQHISCRIVQKLMSACAMMLHQPWYNILCYSVSFQIFPKVLPEVQPELSKECREPKRHATLPGKKKNAHWMSLLYCTVNCNEGSVQLFSTHLQKHNQPGQSAPDIFFITKCIWSLSRFFWQS